MFASLRTNNQLQHQRPIFSSRDNTRFHLEKYKTPASRHTCPQCQRKREFAFYVDEQSEIVFPDHVGKCNRSDNCGYHYTPKQFFQDNPEWKMRINNEVPKWENMTTAQKGEYQKGVGVLHRGYKVIEKEVMEATLKAYEKNTLVNALAETFGFQNVVDACKLYKVGTIKTGGALFWLLDPKGNVVNGKLIGYKGANRTKEFNWVERVNDLEGKETGFTTKCFFGAHLLPKYSQATVCIVESEKSALVASLVYNPRDMIFLASGGCHIGERIQVLKRRRVILIPDCSPWEIVSENGTKSPGPRTFFQKSMQELSAMGCVVDWNDLNPEWGLTKECPHNGFDIADAILAEPEKWIKMKQPKPEPPRTLTAALPEIENYNQYLQNEWGVPMPIEPIHPPFIADDDMPF